MCSVSWATGVQAGCGHHCPKVTRRALGAPCAPSVRPLGCTMTGPCNGSAAGQPALFTLQACSKAQHRFQCCHLLRACLEGHCHMRGKSHRAQQGDFCSLPVPVPSQAFVGPLLSADGSRQVSRKEARPSCRESQGSLFEGVMPQDRSLHPGHRSDARQSVRSLTSRLKLDQDQPIEACLKPNR